MSLLRREGDDVVLCCNGKKCPTVRKIGDGKIRIKDDYGNVVVMTAEQAKLIPNALKEL